MSDEKFYYNKGSIIITNYRAVINGTTYPVKNMTSVSSFILRLDGWKIGWATAMFLFGVPAMFLSVFVGMIAILIGCAFWYWHSSRPQYRYWVRLGMSGTENNAVYSDNKADVEEIINALNNAIIQL